MEWTTQNGVFLDLVVIFSHILIDFSHLFLIGGVGFPSSQTVQDCPLGQIETKNLARGNFFHDRDVYFRF